MFFATINGTDISEHIQESTYLVDSYEVNYIWEDGFYKKNKEVIRHKVKGKFEVVFFTLEAFNAFKSLTDVTDENGCLDISLMVTNTNQVADIKAYVTISTSQHSEVSESTVVYRYSVSVEER